VKRKNAVAHGAVGELSIMLPEDWKRYAWEWLVPQIQAGEMHWLDKSGIPHDFFPELRGNALFGPQGAELVFASALKTLEQVSSAAHASKPQAFALPVNSHIHTEATQSVIPSPNIVAELKGSDAALRDQYVVYTAHLDHLGIYAELKGSDAALRDQYVVYTAHLDHLGIYPAVEGDNRLPWRSGQRFRSVDVARNRAPLMPACRSLRDGPRSLCS